MERPTLEHPVLGHLCWNPSLDSWETEVEVVAGSPIRFAIVAEGGWAHADSESMFAAGAEYLSWARQAESGCREWITEQCLEGYNQSWADEDPNEGPPPLTRFKFMAFLRLAGITLFDNGAAHWVYDTGELFAGHGLSVYVDDHRVFCEPSLLG
jgi:hypothetical protein